MWGRKASGPDENRSAGLPKGGRGLVRRTFGFVVGVVVLVGAMLLANTSALHATSYVRSEGADLSTVYTLPYRIPSAPVSEAMETAMLALLNQDRAAAGRLPLTRDLTIRVAARNHGTDMFAFGFLSHTSRDGRTPWDRVVSAGMRPHVVGENLAYASGVREANTLLMESPGHRANILSPEYHRVGIGVVDGGDRGVIVVEDFTN